MACFWNLLFGSLLRRSIAVLYAPVSATFDTVHRQPTAWVVTLVYSFAYVAAPATTRTIRDTQMPLKELSLIGTACIGFSQMASFFLGDVYLFVGVLGILCGVGTGVTSVVNEVIVCQYFVRQRRAASGLNYAGTAIAACVFPALVLQLIDAYGLHGALLISGGLTLNGLAGSLFFLQPPWSNIAPPKVVIPVVSAEEFQKRASADTSAVVSMEGNLGDGAPVAPTGPVLSSQQGAGISGSSLPTSAESNSGQPREVNAPLNKMLSRQPPDRRQKPPGGQPQKNAMVAWLVLISAVLTSYSVMIQSILLDYAVELGLGEHSGLAMIALVALGDLFARMNTQDVLVKVGHCKAIALICFLNGGTLFIMSVVANAPMLLLLSGAFGITSGSLVMGFVPLLSRFAEPDQVHTFAERARFAMAAALLLGPVFVGIFKDTFGSYSGLFQITGFLSVVAGLTWLPSIKEDTVHSLVGPRLPVFPAMPTVSEQKSGPFYQAGEPGITGESSPSPEAGQTPGPTETEGTIQTEASGKTGQSGLTGGLAQRGEPGHTTLSSETEERPSGPESTAGTGELGKAGESVGPKGIKKRGEKNDARPTPQTKDQRAPGARGQINPQATRQSVPPAKKPSIPQVGGQTRSAEAQKVPQVGSRNTSKVQRQMNPQVSGQARNIV